MQVLAYWLKLLVNNIGPAWNSIIVVAMINNYLLYCRLFRSYLYVEIEAIFSLFSPSIKTLATG